MRVESKRLVLYTASNDEMKKLIDGTHDTDLKQAYSEMLQGCIENPEDRIWYAAWFIELKKQPEVIIGEFSFKGLNDDGMIEIGYGLKKGFCGHGYMTETVKKISEWALSQKYVSRIEAEADENNIASQNVLLNAGFIATGEKGAEGLRFVYMHN